MNISIIDRLRKLINHERSARSIGSVAEAELFAEKIQELLDLYNLSLSDIDMKEVRKTTGQTKVDMKINHYWQSVFANAIASFNGCRIVGRWDGMLVIGATVDRLIVIEIYEYFESLCRIFADRYMKEYHKSKEYRRKLRKHMHSRKQRNSYSTGFVAALIKRFREKHDAALAAQQTSTALIFIGNKLADADDWIEDNLRVVEVSNGRPGRAGWDWAAFHHGVADGDKVALTTKTVAPTPASEPVQQALF
jgi:hypothetical protein